VLAADVLVPVPGSPDATDASVGVDASVGSLSVTGLVDPPSPVATGRPQATARTTSAAEIHVRNTTSMRVRVMFGHSCSMQ
jgi:hypothetical protein